MIEGSIVRFLSNKEIVVNRGTREGVTFHHICVIKRGVNIYALLLPDRIQEKMSTYRSVWVSTNIFLCTYRGPITIGTSVSLIILSEKQQDLLKKALAERGIYVA